MIFSATTLIIYLLISVEKWRCVKIGQKAGEEEKDNINIFLYLTNNNDLIPAENDKTYSCELTDKNWGTVNFDDEYLINWTKEEDGRLCLMRETQKKIIIILEKPMFFRLHIIMKYLQSPL